MHFCCHVKENWFVRNCPLINTIRRHHTAHHNNQLMKEINLNLTFPIADYFLVHLIWIEVFGPFTEWIFNQIPKD